MLSQCRPQSAQGGEVGNQIGYLTGSIHSFFQMQPVITGRIPSGKQWQTSTNHSPSQTGPIVGLVGHTGRIERQREQAHRLLPDRVVDKRQGDLVGRLIGHQPPFDLLLRRDRDDRVPFDYSLTGQGIASRQVIGSEAQRGAATHPCPVLHYDSTTSAAPLTAAGHIQIQASLARYLGKERAGWCLNGLAGRLKAYAVRSDRAPPLPLSPLHLEIIGQVHRFARANVDLPAR